LEAGGFILAIAAKRERLFLRGFLQNFPFHFRQVPDAFTRNLYQHNIHFLHKTKTRAFAATNPLRQRRRGYARPAKLHRGNSP
jgi:hypothetical protein